MTRDTWNPAQYAKFQHERELPFFDLLALIRPAPAMRVVDLGCGTGRLTRLLHSELRARETIGVDRSPHRESWTPPGSVSTTSGRATRGPAPYFSAHGDVSGLCESGDLTREDLIVSVIVGDCGERARVDG